MTEEEAETFYEEDEPVEDVVRAFEEGQEIAGQRPRKRPAMIHKRYRERLPNLGRRVR